MKHYTKWHYNNCFLVALWLFIKKPGAAFLIMRGNRILTPVHFAILDADNNFWHFRRSKRSQWLLPLLTFGRIEATQVEKIRSIKRIYEKKVLLSISKSFKKRILPLRAKARIEVSGATQSYLSMTYNDQSSKFITVCSANLLERIKGSLESIYPVECMSMEQSNEDVFTDDKTYKGCTTLVIVLSPAKAERIIDAMYKAFREQLKEKGITEFSSN